MTDISVLLPPKKTAISTPQRPPVRGVINIAAGAVTDPTVSIIVPGHTSDYSGDCRWVRQGDALPQAGADCLIVYDETGAGTVVAWEGAGVSLTAIAAAIDARLDVLEAVHSGGATISAGSPAVIGGQSGGIVSATRQAAGITRIVFSFNVADTSHIWCSATIVDNSAATSSVAVISASPATVDVYTWNSAASALDRTFMLLWRA